MGTCDHVRDHFGFSRVRNRRLKNSDNYGRSAAEQRVEPDCLADDARVPIESRRPERIGQHRRACRSGAVVARSEEPAKHGPQSHHFEIIATDNTRAHLPRLAEADHRERYRRELADLGERVHALAQITDLGNGEGGVFPADSRRALANIDNAFFSAVNQRAQEYRPHQPEDRDVYANPQRQRQDDRHGQPFHPGDGTNCKPEFLNERHISPSHSVNRRQNLDR